MVGVPARVAVPLPLSVKVTPGGTLAQPNSAPGTRWRSTVKLNGDPTVDVALAALVKAGAWPTTSVKRLGGVGADPVGGRDGEVGGAGGRRRCPRAVAVPLPLSVKVSPAGQGRPSQ